MGSKLYVSGTNIPYVVVKNSSGTVLNSACKRVRAYKNGTYYWVIKDDIGVTFTLGFKLWTESTKYDCATYYDYHGVFNSLKWSVSYDSVTTSASLTSIKLTIPCELKIGNNYENSYMSFNSGTSSSYVKSISNPGTSGSTTFTSTEHYAEQSNFDNYGVDRIKYDGTPISIVYVLNGTTRTLYIYDFTFTNVPISTTASRTTVSSATITT